MRSSPSRSAVPGAMRARLARSGSLLALAPDQAGMPLLGTERQTGAGPGGSGAADPGDVAVDRHLHILRIDIHLVTLRCGNSERDSLSSRRRVNVAAHLSAVATWSTSRMTMPGGVGPLAAGPQPGRYQRISEAEPGGLGEPAGDGTDPAHLAGQPDLADGHQVGWATGIS